MLPNSKPIKDISDSLVTDRGTTSDYQNIADEFNKFFCSIGSIGSNLANNFSNTSFKSFSTYLNKRVSSSIYLNIPNRTEIFNPIYSLKNNKAVGHDDISAFFLRIASSVIIPYLQVFIEFCFTEGAFRENCTITRIKFISAKSKFCDSSSPYYKRLKILKLKDLYKLEVGKFIHSNFKKCFPKICLIILTS